MRWLFRLLRYHWTVKRALHLRAMEPGDLAPLFETQDRELGQEWLDRQDRGALYVAVAEVGGVPAGRRCLDFALQAHTGAVYCFAATVLPHWRSRGIGTLIDRHCQAIARARGFHALQTAVSKSNVRGIAWHKRLGYRRIDERVVRWKEPDGPHESDCWVLERRWGDEPPFRGSFLGGGTDRQCARSADDGRVEPPLNSLARKHQCHKTQIFAG